jgi:hypothetical protein
MKTVKKLADMVKTNYIVFSGKKLKILFVVGKLTILLLSLYMLKQVRGFKFLKQQ